jgi:solute carrier family 35 protein F5
MQHQSAEPWASFLFADQSADVPASRPQPSFSPRYALGLFFIFLQCLTWIFAAILTQYLFEDSGFQSPFLMTYIGMSMLSVMLPIQLWKEYQESKQFLDSPDSFDHELTNATTYADYWHILSRRSSLLIADKTTRWNHKKHFLAALHVAAAMFLADYMFNSALANTSVASATVVVSTQSVIVLLLAVLVRVETFSWAKLLGVLLSFVGTALTTLADAGDDEDQGTILGDLFAFIAALAYASYSVQVRVLCPQDEELYNMQLLLGYIGILCLIPLAPVALYMILTQVQLTPRIFGMLLVKGLLDFCLTDYLLFRSIILTNATVATVGLGMTIPMAFLADWAVGKLGAVSIYSILGALAVTVGFLIVNLVPEKEEKEQRVELEPHEAESGNTKVNYVDL